MTDHTLKHLLKTGGCHMEAPLVFSKGLNSQTTLTLWKLIVNVVKIALKGNVHQAWTLNIVILLQVGIDILTESIFIKIEGVAFLPN